VKVHIDFETRSQADIWKVGAWEYSTHPSTRILCISYAIEDEEPKLLPFNSWDFRELIRLAKDPNVIFCAHNAFFEQAIWGNILYARFNLPYLPPERWECTASRSLAYALPAALEKAADALGLPQRKDKKGAQVMRSMCSPRRPEVKKGEDPNGIYWNEDSEDFKILYEYCKQDVRTERELDKRVPPLSAQERKVWIYDQYMNMRGVKVDRDSAKKVVEFSYRKRNELNARLESLTDGAVTAGTETQGLVNYLNNNGCSIENMQKATVKKAIDSGVLSGKNLEILKIRTQTSKTSLAKFEAMLLATQKDGVLRDLLKYHGAFTGRWAGQLVQTQNLIKPLKGLDTDEAIEDLHKLSYEEYFNKYNNFMGTLSSCVRGMFIPGEGKVMHIADYSAIEACTLMWAAGEDLGLSEFRATFAGTAEDIYVQMAQRIYNNPSLTKEKNPAERNLGKQAILGCGYGMGAVRFTETCASYGINIDQPTAQKIVNLYRNTYPEVIKFWYAMEKAAIDAMQHPNTVFKCKMFAYYFDNSYKVLMLCLPSGRIIYYQSPDLCEGKFGNTNIRYWTVDSVTKKWGQTQTYYGKLVENAIQAVARDLMVFAFPKLEENGYQILFHTHDEIVTQSSLAKTNEEMVNLMIELPAWAKGLPLNAEAQTIKRYRK